MIDVINAKFVKSAASISDSLPIGPTEIAFLGRSNVGKSSLINSLCNQKALAKSSCTPGKTRLINFFDITFKDGDDRHAARFVDLPGFGYAKVSKSELEKWQASLTEFIGKRTAISIFLILIDSRHPDLEIDIATREYIKSFFRKDFEIIEVFTKIDKLNRSELDRLKGKNQSGFFVSSTSKKGINELRTAIFTKIFRGFGEASTTNNI
jgi:GTP-binding protein